MAATLTFRRRNKIDKLINGVVSRRCAGLQIDIMDIPKVFEAGYAAATADGPVETLNDRVEAAVVSEYTRLSVNTR